MILRLTPIFLTALALSACDSSTVTDAGTDAGSMRDDAPTIADAPSTTDTPSTDAPSSTDAALPATAVTLTYRSHTENVPRALFGYERTEGAITEIYFELSRGGDDGCPSESSATPDQILTVSGYLGTELGTQDAGIMTAFFNFEGSFREEIAPAMSTAATLELLTLDQEAGTATGNVDITFDEGSAIGGFSAVHCDSLDTE